jgi:hypothetical protein
MSSPLVSPFSEQKIMVLPALSTVLYKYIHAPYTMMYVSSIRQLLPTAFFLFLKVFSMRKVNLLTHHWMVAWSTVTPLIDNCSSTPGNSN